MGDSGFCKEAVDADRTPAGNLTRVTLPRRAAALALVAVVGAGCSLPGASAPPSPDPAPPPTATSTPTPSATAASKAPDLTVPGAATQLVADLLDAAGATRAVMVTVTEDAASVAVLRGGQPHTWAWRDGRIREVPSDIAYVAQRTFDPDDFDFDDVGALFRAAESVSGSRQSQSLQIVDYSGGLVSMSVSTNPESRAVFFRPDGTLLPTLDFTSPWGLREGYADAVGERTSATAVGFGSGVGVYLDGPQRSDGGFDRRQRTARTPVLVTPRTEAADLETFDPRTVDPQVVWGVLAELQDEGEFALDTVWTCVVNHRAGAGRPRMHFTVGDRSFTTTLTGSEVPG